MLKIKSTQAQQSFGRIMDQALAGEDVIVERYGTPRVVIVGFQRYRSLVEAERELLRTRLQQASAAASSRTAHLSEREIEALIEQARTEAHEARARK